MRFFLNLTWFLLVGLVYFLLYVLFGIICCVSIIFIPSGIKCFKGAMLALRPFGRTVNIDPSNCATRNILWCAFFGLEMAILSFIVGVLLCATVIGIPYGLQCFKIMKFSYAPFGATIECE